MVGLAYVADDWRSSRRRMDFIRFTGEWFVYFVLIALGGGVLTAFTVGTFKAIGIDPDDFISQWLLPCGAVAAVVVAGWLVEAKQSVVENIAPVLTRLFTPLFTAVLLAFLVAVVWTSHRHRRRAGGADPVRPAAGRRAGPAALLDLGPRPAGPARPVRPAAARPRGQRARHRRAGAGGRSPDGSPSTAPPRTRRRRSGENVILLANLAWSAWLLLGFVRRRAPFAALERWQTGYLPVYAGWAWIVVLLFPPLFSHL